MSDSQFQDLSYDSNVYHQLKNKLAKQKLKDNQQLSKKNHEIQQIKKDLKQSKNNLNKILNEKDLMIKKLTEDLLKLSKIVIDHDSSTSQLKEQLLNSQKQFKFQITQIIQENQNLISLNSYLLNENQKVNAICSDLSIKVKQNQLSLSILNKQKIQISQKCSEIQIKLEQAQTQSIFFQTGSNKLKKQITLLKQNVIKAQKQILTKNLTEKRNTILIAGLNADKKKLLQNNQQLILKNTFLIQQHKQNSQNYASQVAQYEKQLDLLRSQLNQQQSISRFSIRYQSQNMQKLRLKSNLLNKDYQHLEHHCLQLQKLLISKSQQIKIQKISKQFEISQLFEQMQRLKYTLEKEIIALKKEGYLNKRIFEAESLKRIEQAKRPSQLNCINKGQISKMTISTSNSQHSIQLLKQRKLNNDLQQILGDLTKELEQKNQELKGLQRETKGLKQLAEKYQTDKAQWTFMEQQYQNEIKKQEKQIEQFVKNISQVKPKKHNKKFKSSQLFNNSYNLFE